MTRTTHIRTARRGVTLVEMLVATAMCIIGMWMLTWMFQQATASFSLANAQASLTGQERMVTTVMARDLEADRFPEDDTQPTNRGRKLSDLKPGTAPRAGYFWAYSSPSDRDGNVSEAGGFGDSYGFKSSRSISHQIRFTSVLPDVPNNRFIAEVPAGSGTTHSGVAAEISYFLANERPSPTNPAVKLYDLMRVQRLVALTNYDADVYTNTAVKPGYQPTPPTPADAVHEVMVCTPGASPKMNTLADLAAAYSATSPRFGSTSFPAQPRAVTSKRYGEDRLLSNVLSFEVKFTGVGPSWPTTYANGNTDYPYDTLPAPSFTFDSTTPGNLRITGVQIRIRALSGTNARQTTIVLSL